jgi:predicted dehydrogenase
MDPILGAPLNGGPIGGSQSQNNGVVSRRFALAAAIAPLVGVHQATARHAGRKLRIGAIGVGNRGANNIYDMETEEIVALADVDSQYLAKMKFRHPRARVFQDYRELLQIDELDAVIVSTPDHHHALAVCTALARGLDVYCEKPLAHNVAEVRLLRDLASRHTGVAVMGNQHHDSLGYRAVRRVIQSGEIGDVREIHVWTAKPLWPQGHLTFQQQKPPEQLNWDLWLGPAAEKPFHDRLHPYLWRGWWEYGTGALGDMGPHLLDPIFRTLRLPLPQRVEYISGTATELSPPVSSRLRFHFSRVDEDAIVIDWYDGANRPVPEIAGVSRLPGHGALVVGDRATLFIPQLGKRPLMLVDAKSTPVELSPTSPQSSQRMFVEACHGRVPQLSPFSYGADLTETCLLGNVAIQLQKTIERDKVTGKFPEDVEAALGRKYREGWELPHG